MIENKSQDNNQVKLNKDGSVRKKSGPPKGSRPSGRKKGSPNKRTLRLHDKVNDYLKGRGYKGEFDPAFVLAEMLLEERARPSWTDPETGEVKGGPDRDRMVTICGKLMTYYHPARKAIEFEPMADELPVLRVVLCDQGEDTGKAES